MTWCFTYPGPTRIASHLASQARLPFSYPAVGASAGEPPTGYTVDHNRVQLGGGPGTFSAACTALLCWQQFPAPWTRIHPDYPPLVVGTTVAVIARAYGLWWLNAARIVYVIKEPRRFGFAYGTLPGHVEEGEERFTVEWHADGTVWYDLLAFSRPQHPLVRLAGPLARRMQRRFVRDSQAAMREACR